MKFSTTTSASMIAAAVAVPSATGNGYHCHIEVTYTKSKSSHDDIDADLGVLSAIPDSIVSSFNDAYHGIDGIDMIKDVPTPTEGDELLFTDTTTSLRGGTPTVGMLGGKHGSNGYWGCNWCRDDDNVAVGGTDEDEIDYESLLALEGPHSAWVTKFCEAIGSTGCKIEVSSCSSPVIAADSGSFEVESEVEIKIESAVESDVESDIEIA